MLIGGIIGFVAGPLTAAILCYPLAYVGEWWYESTPNWDRARLIGTWFTIGYGLVAGVIGLMVGIVLGWAIHRDRHGVTPKSTHA